MVVKDRGNGWLPAVLRTIIEIQGNGLRRRDGAIIPTVADPGSTNELPNDDDDGGECQQGDGRGSPFGAPDQRLEGIHLDGVTGWSPNSSRRLVGDKHTRRQDP